MREHWRGYCPQVPLGSLNPGLLRTFCHSHMRKLVDLASEIERNVAAAPGRGRGRGRPYRAPTGRPAERRRPVVVCRQEAVVCADPGSRPAFASSMRAPPSPGCSRGRQSRIQQQDLRDNRTKARALLPPSGRPLILSSSPPSPPRPAATWNPSAGTRAKIVDTLRTRMPACASRRSTRVAHRRRRQPSHRPLRCQC